MKPYAERMNALKLGNSCTATVVLVHGAWEDASCWLDVTARLHALGYRVVGAQCSLRSLQEDVATVQRIITLEAGPIVLVGHGWGGNIITEAGLADSVAGLIYVAASAPDKGCSAPDAFGVAWPLEHWALLRQDSAGFLWFPQEVMPNWFAQDIPPASAALLASVQRPIHSDAVYEKVSAAAWRDKPSWYLVTALDRVIPEALQRKTAKRIGASTKTLPSGHVPFFSHANETAAFISSAVVNVLKRTKR